MDRKLLAVLVVILMLVGADAQAVQRRGGGGGGGGRSYSSGGSRSYSSGSSRSSAPSSSGSSRSYSSGGSSSTATAPRPSSSGSAGSSAGTAGKSYSSGSRYTPGTKPTASSGGAGSGFNSGMSKQGQRVESQKRYTAAAAPKSSYTTPGPGGVNKPIQPNSPQVQTVRRYVTHERYITYDNRASGFYGGYYGRPSFFHDSFSPFLMGWMFSSALSSHDRAMWAYNHQNEMDQARYQEMLRRDAQLQAEIDQLKAAKTPIDPSFVPAAMKDNPDLMYSKEFVDAAYNPVEVAGASSGHGWLYSLFVSTLVVGALGYVGYLLFFKEFGPPATAGFSR